MKYIHNYHITGMKKSKVSAGSKRVHSSTILFSLTWGNSMSSRAFGLQDLTIIIRYVLQFLHHNLIMILVRLVSQKKLQILYTILSIKMKQLFPSTL